MCAGEAARLSAALVQQGPLGTGRKGLLTWLVGAADNTKQVATTRAKAIKALGSVAETDPRLLASSAVQKGVNKALQVTPCAPCRREPCLTRLQQVELQCGALFSLVLLCVFRKFCYLGVQSLLDPLLWQDGPLIGTSQPTFWSLGSERAFCALLHMLSIYRIHMNSRAVCMTAG